MSSPLNRIKVCVAVVLSWSAGRKTTYEADGASCLLELLKLTMTVRYGGAEEQLAFQRLQERVTNDCCDEWIFAWTFPPLQQYSKLKSSGMLAPSIECFSRCGNLTINNADKYRPRHHDVHKVSGDPLIFWVPTTASAPILSRIILDMSRDPLLSSIRGAINRSQSIALNCWSVNAGNDSNTAKIKLSKDGRSAPWHRANCHQLDWTSGVKRSVTMIGRADVTEEVVIAC